ncbi:MAG TPA: 3-phosphoshikimate 1-carboxyvinyltransferase [Gemmatimonadales bacterium]|nr:3-phosphoshikimate 1-carboxyvinyltransferase [Gemmatimonadales bacterium]
MKVGGVVRVPGDKSITHRLLMLAAMARGSSHIGGALTSLDARATAACLRRMGVDVSPLRADAVTRVAGRGRLSRPSARLHCGNAGTTARLLLGLLAGHRFEAELTGDKSLRRRPMARVTEPLGRMGAKFAPRDARTLPLAIRGGKLSPLRWDLPVSSAQIKGSLLFAGLAGGVGVSLREPGGLSRDHSERLLRAFGFTVETRGGRIEFEPTGRVVPFQMQVPGDPSSAAFLVGLALLAEGGELTLPGVGVNPTRTGFLAVLGRMGAQVEAHEVEDAFGEPVGTLLARPGVMRRTEVSAAEIPGLVDEVPLLAVLASRAEGTTIFREVGELRVKESDRLSLIASNLRAVGSEAEVVGNDLHVRGGDAPPMGRVRTEGDHRLAMAFAVLGTVRGARIAIDDKACADVSFPGFFDTLRQARRSGA